MTKKELSINVKWDEFEMGTCRLFVETLNQYIPAVFFQDHKPKPTISDKMLQSVNDILNMDKKEFDRLGEIVGLETYQQSKIKEIHFDQDNDIYVGVYSEVILSTGAKEQVSIVVKDGTFLCVNDGTYFDKLVELEEEKKKYVPTKEEREHLVAKLLSS